ncbi:hypothetical protein [Jatrophihabitans fulvus]
MVVVEGYAMVLDDRNSDGQEVELSIFRVDHDGWRFLCERDDVGYPPAGATGDVASGGSLGFDGEYYDWAAGRDAPHARVTLHWHGHSVDVAADDDGWWLFVRPTTQAEAGRIRRAW